MQLVPYLPSCSRFNMLGYLVVVLIALLQKTYASQLLMKEQKMDFLLALINFAIQLIEK